MSQAFPTRAVLLLAFAAFSSAAATRAIDPLLVPIAQEFGTTPGGASIAATAFLVSYGFLQFFHGPIGDRVGKYRLVFIYTLVSAATMFLCALVPTLDLLALVRLASGAVVGGIITLALAWIGDVVTYERRQAVLAQFMIGQLLGVGGGAAIAGLIAEHYGWRAVFHVLGVGMLVVTLGLWLETRRAEPPQPAFASGRSFAGDLGAVFGLLSRPWVRVVFGSVMAEGIFMYGALAFVPLHLHRALAMSVGESGASILLFAAGGLSYALSAHALVPRLGERGLARVGGANMAIGVGLIGFASVPAVALAGLFLTGTGFYSFHNTLQTNATQMAPDARGSGVSLFAFGLFGGSSLGVFLGGLFVDAIGTRPLLLASAGGIAVLAVYFSHGVGKRLVKA